MAQQLTEGARYPLIEGGTFTADVPDGGELMIQRDGQAVVTVTVSGDDGATYDPPAAGRYYLAVRRNSTATFCLAGVLDVIPLVDATEEQLVAELAKVNTQIDEAFLSHAQYQISDPSGTAATRMTLGALQRYRSTLEIRLSRYRTAMQGGLPVRLT